MEALKLGKPVVGAGSGGTLEQIEDGVNGFLFPPGDHRELAAKIKYLYDHPKLAQKMGRQGKKWALKTFTPKRYQEELQGILDRIPRDAAGLGGKGGMAAKVEPPCPGKPEAGDVAVQLEIFLI